MTRISPLKFAADRHGIPVGNMFRPKPSIATSHAINEACVILTGSGLSRFHIAEIFGESVKWADDRVKAGRSREAELGAALAESPDALQPASMAYASAS